METNSLGNPSRRRRHNRQGGGNRNRSQGGGGRNSRNRNRNRNRSGGGGGNRNRSQGGGGSNRSRSRRSSTPKQTRFQKILSVLTFGLLGKPKPKPKARKKPQEPKPTARQQMRAEQANAPQEGKEKKKRNRSEVTSGRLYVGNLSYDTSEPELEDLFRGFGNVLSVEVVTNSRNQQSKGFAFVEMVSIDAAKRAVEILDDEEFMGRKLIVTGARSDGPREETDDAPAPAPEPVEEETPASEAPTQPLVSEESELETVSENRG